MQAIPFATLLTTTSTTTIKPTTKIIMNPGTNYENHIESNHLADLITKNVNVDVNVLGKLVIVDCRRFLDYNMWHIKDAVNICCSKLIKKRLQENKMSLFDVLRPCLFGDRGSDSSSSSIEMLENDVGSQKFNVVLYAENCATQPNSSRPNTAGRCAKKCTMTDDLSFLSILMEKLCAHSQFHSVRMLKGGFVDFQARYPELCEGASTGTGGVIGRGIVGSGAMQSPARSPSSNCGSASKLTLTSLSQPCLPVSNQGPTKILSFLYLGSQQDAMDQDTLKRYGINYVLNMSIGCPKPDFVQDEHFMRIAVNDSHSEKLLPYFEKAFEFLDKAKEANSCVLVHCLAGISRSPTLAIAYVMRHSNCSSEEAYRYVKEKRPAISPNFNFLGQLLEYEKQLKVTKQEESTKSFNSATSTVTSISLLPSCHAESLLLPKISAPETAPAPSTIIEPASQQITALPSVTFTLGSSKTPPDFTLSSKPLFLNLQKNPMTQCSSSSEINSMVDTTTTAPVTSSVTSIKRSASCPIKIQKAEFSVGNGLRDALNLELKFSPATKFNSNGKRRMVEPEPESACNADIKSKPEMNVTDKIEPMESPIDDCASDLRNFIGKFDKIQTAKFFGSDYFNSARCASPKMNFGVKVLKPLHEELPSPSTELSKLNFDSLNEKMDFDPLTTTSATNPFLHRKIVQSPLTMPATAAVMVTTSSSNSNPTSTWCPKTEVQMTRKNHDKLFVSNPFFSSSSSSIKNDFRSISASSSSSTFICGNSKIRKTNFDASSSNIPNEKLRFMDEKMEIDEEKSISSVTNTTNTLTTTTTLNYHEVIEKRTCLENPLFMNSNFKSQLQVNNNNPPNTAPIMENLTSKCDQHQQQKQQQLLKSIKSESQLFPTTMREKLSSTGAMLFESFSQRMRNLLAKRASWPHAIPYLPGIKPSESDWSRMLASDVGEYDTREKTSQENHVDLLKSPTKSKSESTIFHSTINERFLAPPPPLPSFYELDSPESGFLDSPIHSKSSSTPPPPPSATSAASSTASSLFFNRNPNDPERDSLGSSSSLEIIVS